MFLKSCVVGTPLVLGAFYAGGAFDGYSREVGRPPAEVAQALADLDLTQQPGSPGTDPARSGGVPSLFHFAQKGDELHWIVTNGDKVAVTMIATLTPVEGGRTRVTARVERGNAPDDFVAPAFRSTGITLGLFSMALEDELNDLTKPPQQSAEACAAIFERLMAGTFGPGLQPRAEDLGSAIAQGSKNVLRLSAVQAEARRQGCEPPGFDESGPRRSEIGVLPSDEMRAAANMPMPSSRRDERGISFAPGKPMVDPTPSGSRPGDGYRR